MIDPSIPLMAKGIDGLQMLDDGNKLAQLWQGQKVNAEMGRLYKQAGGDQAKMMELGQNSPLMHLVMPKLQEQQAAQQNALIARQKTISEIGKTNSEAYKNNQQGGGYGLDNSQKQLGAIQSAVQQASMTGDKGAAIIGLDAARRVGLITQEDYQQQEKMLMAMAPEQVKAYAQSVTFANAKDPASIAFQTANNVADNETTMRGQDINKTVADNRLGFDYQKEEADNQFKYDSLGQDDSQFWASFNQKDAQFYSDQDFQLMKTKLEKQQVKNETPEQKMERVNNTIGSADAARQAARAAQDAAALINHPGIVSGTGLTSAFGMVPGTDAKDFKARLENLKSQVFLPTVKSLQGMGALSNAEGEKIASAVANLDPSLGQEALAKQLAILAQQMSSSAKKAQQQTQNYATRGGTIQLQTQNRGNSQGGKVYTQAMIQQYAQQSGRTAQEVAQAVRDSGGTIR